MKRLGIVLVVLFLGWPLAAVAVPGGSHTFGGWQQSVVDPDQNFRGLAAVSRSEAWITGESLSDGPARVFHTVDGGTTWQDVSPPDTTGLSFRDVEVHHGVVNVLAIGPGDASRIYRTTDAGHTWTIAFRNTDPNAFYDCMAFYPGGRFGLAVSDPVDGRFRILATRDGGRSWAVLPNAGMPDSAGEGGFAASGGCLTTVGKTAYLVSGGAQSRAFRSTDRGLTWTATPTGIPAGDAAGTFSADFANPRHGIAVGGDFADPANGTDAAAYTRDGRTWHASDLTHVGEDVAYLGGSSRVALATGNYGGSIGTSLTTDGGVSWQRVSDLGYHTVDCTPAGFCWAAGAHGQVAHTR